MSRRPWRRCHPKEAPHATTGHRAVAHRRAVLSLCRSLLCTKLARMGSDVTDNNASRQPILDAVIALQGLRLAASTALAAANGQEVGEARIMARGQRVPAWMMRRTLTARHLLSTRPRTTAQQLRESIPVNNRCLHNGLSMVSIFDRDGTKPAARRILANETEGVYFLSYAPVQMRLVDHREVYLQGPLIGGEGSIMCLTSVRVLEAAHRYWQAVLHLAEPCRPESDLLPSLSARQQQIMELLRQGMADARVAQMLGVSTRTVRYEVAAVMTELGARSRFAAGLLYAEKFLQLNRSSPT